MDQNRVGEVVDGHVHVDFDLALLDDQLDLQVGPEIVLAIVEIL